MRHIFISHVAEDTDVAVPIAQGLEAAGYQTWHYTRDSLPGVSYLVQTARAIEQAQAVVVVISRQALGAHQVTVEVVRAHEGSKPFFPVLRDITHEALQQQPDWRQAMGAAVSLRLPSDGVPTIMLRLIEGLKALDIQPGLPAQAGVLPTVPSRQPGVFSALLYALRQGVARYWRRLVSWLAGIFVLLNGLKALELEGIHVPGVTGRAWHIGLGLVFLILVRFPRLAMLITRTILGPPKPPAALSRLFRGPRPYGREDVLPGRQREVGDCWKQLREAAFFILEGESGCGKSSLLNAALLPQAQQAFRVITCRIADDPLGKLRAALLQEPYRASPVPLPPAALAEAIGHAVHTNGTGTPDHPEPPKPLLLCIDQCEEFFVTVRDEVRWQCLAVLKDAIQEGQLRLLMAVRSDFRDLLDHLCRTVDPPQQTLNLGRYYTLQAFHAGQANAVLDEMLQPARGNDPLLYQQLEDFARALVDDLLRPPRDPRLCQADEKTVLPVELQTVGMMLESVGLEQFSAAGLRRRGGKAGLMRAYIDDAKTYVWHKTGVLGDQALLILRQLISPARTKWAQTAHAIGQALGMPAAQVAQVLDAFAEQYLVNRLPAETASGNGADVAATQRYELMHEYLVQILAEAPDPGLQKAQDAEEGLRFWLHRTQAVFTPPTGCPWRWRLARVRALFAKPMPLLESLRLWRYARRGEERRLLVRNLRGFGLRLGLVALLLSPVGWYMLREATLRWQNVGTLQVSNPTGARLTLTHIRHYGSTQTASPEERSLQGLSVHLAGPADYMITATAQSGGVWTVRYPVYIHGYGHQITVAVDPPSGTILAGMVYIPGGVFRMGDKESLGQADARPPHDVEVDGFFIDQYEVTNAQYEQCVKAGKCEAPHSEDETCYTLTLKGWEPTRLDRTFQEPTKPVVCVNWHQASAYCAYVGKRLPTEAEWEKAAAGPEGYKWSFGNRFDGIKANYCDKNCDLYWRDRQSDDGYATTAPVGIYSPNGYGLYDMSGNVYEWVEDWYAEGFYGQPEARQNNPVNREEDSGLRVVRGGAWDDYAVDLRVAYRLGLGPDDRLGVVGVRCAARPPR